MGIQIRAMVVGLVVALVGLALYPVYAQATDRLYRQFVQSCQVQGDTVLRLHDTGENQYTLASSGATPATCQIQNYSHGRTVVASSPTGDQVLNGTTFTVNLLNEDNLNTALTGTYATGETTATITVSGGLWRTLSPVLTRFGTINQLLAQILPLLLAVSFIGLGFLIARQGNIAVDIGNELSVLLISVVAVYLMPVAIDFIIPAEGVVSGGNLTVTARFGSIITLVFSLLPLLMTVGIMALISQRGYSAITNQRGTSAVGSGGAF